MKKKLILFAITVTVMAGVSKAQESTQKSLFSISTGFASFNYGKQGGMFLSNSYIRNYQTRFTYGAKVFFAHGEGNVEGLEPQHDIHISTSAFDFSGFVSPLKSPKHILLLGVGVSLDFTRTSYLSNTDFTVVNDKIYTIADTDGLISFMIPVFDIYYAYNLKNNFYLGLHYNGRDVHLYQSLIGINASVKF